METPSEEIDIDLTATYRIGVVHQRLEFVENNEHMSCGTYMRHILY